MSSLVDGVSGRPWRCDERVGERTGPRDHAVGRARRPGGARAAAPPSRASPRPSAPSKRVGSTSPRSSARLRTPVASAALELERLAAAGMPSTDRLRAEREHQHQAAAALGELVHEAERAGDRALAERLTRLLHATHETARVLDAGATSLVNNRDISESDVAQYLFVCTGCGRIAEASTGEACPLCGALPPEFAGLLPVLHEVRREPRTPASHRDHRDVAW